MATKKSTKKEENKMAKIDESTIVSIPANELKFFDKNDPLVSQYPELFDDRLTIAVNESLAKSIQVDTQIQPGVVTVFNEQFYVVLGQQRAKACLSIRPDFPFKATVIPFNVNDIVWKRIAENELRTNNTPVMKVQLAAKLASYKNEDGSPKFTVIDLADRFGVSRQQVDNWLIVAEALKANVAGLKDAFESGRIKSTAIATLAKANRKEDGKLDKDKFKAEFEATLSSTPSDGKIKVDQVKREVAGRKEKPKQEELRKILSYPESPYGYQLLVHYILGDNDLTTTMALARQNSVDMEWLVRALEQETEKVQNPRGAGRKKNSTKQTAADALA